MMSINELPDWNKVLVANVTPSYPMGECESLYMTTWVSPVLEAHYYAI